MSFRRLASRFSISLALVGAIAGTAGGCGGSVAGSEGGGGAAIGPTGGSVSSAGGGASLSVPVGAVMSTSTFTIEPIASPGPGSVGQVYDLEPSGLVLTHPVTLTLSYAGADLGGRSASELTLATYANGAWVPVPSTVDEAASTVSAPISHFSPWGITFAASSGPGFCAPGAACQPNSGCGSGSSNGGPTITCGCTANGTLSCTTNPGTAVDAGSAVDASTDPCSEGAPCQDGSGCGMAPSDGGTGMACTCVNGAYSCTP